MARGGAAGELTVIRSSCQLAAVILLLLDARHVEIGLALRELDGPVRSRQDRRAAAVASRSCRHRPISAGCSATSIVERRPKDLAVEPGDVGLAVDLRRGERALGAISGLSWPGAVPGGTVLPALDDRAGLLGEVGIGKPMSSPHGPKTGSSAVRVSGQIPPPARNDLRPKLLGRERHEEDRVLERVGLRRRRREQVIADAAAGGLGLLAELLRRCAARSSCPLGRELFLETWPSPAMLAAAANSGSSGGSSLLAKTP